MFKVLVAGGLTVCAIALPAQVKVVRHDADRRVDVTIDGAPFTSYLWPASLKKPVLFPLITSNGVTVTRGYPLAPREGERVDHPHHAGMWFNYGNVNGFDFWNNSDAIPPERRSTMGTVQHERIVSTKPGTDNGELVVDSVWTTGAGKNLLKQRTRYVFRKQGESRTVDLAVTLTALDRAVFHDDKEGLLGIRVAHFLESPTEKGGTFMDASGQPTVVSHAGAAGATGIYRTSEGASGDTVWATRGTWCSLTGTDAGGQTVTVAILDNPQNPGYPTYWHARGYGLFAANPLGDHIFNPKAPEHNFTLEKDRQVTFMYRVILYAHDAQAQELDRAEAAFAKTSLHEPTPPRR